MFEDILKLGEKTLFVNKLQSLKIEKIGIEFFPHSCNELQDTKSKVSTNNRCNLHGPLKIVFQPVHTGRNDSLDGVGNFNIRGLSFQNVLIILPFNRTVLN